jgi:hypothetical protein
MKAAAALNLISSIGQRPDQHANVDSHSHTGRRGCLRILPRYSLSLANFSLPRKKLPYPALIFDGQLENLVRHPAPASSLIPSPSWPSQRNLSGRSTLSGPSKACLPPRPLTPPPATIRQVRPPSSALDLPWKLGPLALEPTAPSVATALNPKHHRRYLSRQILGHKLLGPMHPSPLDRVIKIFTFESPEPSLLG